MLPRPLLALCLALVPRIALAYPSYYGGNPITATTFSDMGVSALSLNPGTKCIITHTVPSAGYEEGTAYTFTIATDVVSGLGMVWKIGATAGNSGAARVASNAVAWTGTVWRNCFACQ